MNSCPLCSKIFCFTKERTLYFGRLTWSSFLPNSEILHFVRTVFSRV